MTKLLKDMPEHMERIEGNYLLKSEIEHLIDYGYGIDEILEKLTDFVNQNYEWKGVKS